MDFSAKYTSVDKLNADKEGKEKYKTLISNDAFAIAELLQELINESIRGRMNG